jgi:hypothetical protein
MKYVFTGDSSVQNRLINPDMTVYRAETAPSTSGRCDFQIAEVNFIAKTRGVDIFEDDPKPEATFRVQGQQAEIACGRICTQLRMLMKCQHRLFVFTGFVTDSFLRLIYFDRSGACVSERIHHRTITGFEQLLRFFESLFHSTPSQRGLDETIMKQTCKPTVTVVPR